jgi:glycosyltransferase involved in cell wall biosynthesis
MLPVSVFVICKNEEQCIQRCLRSVDFCAEIVVVDSGSTDGTLDILARLSAEGFPIRVIQKDWPGFVVQKQFALEQCTQPWCLNLDADEALDEELRQSLSSLVAAPDRIVAWRIPRRPYLIGYGFTRNHVHSPTLRLIRRGEGAYNLSDKVHEGIRTKGRVAVAQKGHLLHFRALPMDEQILKENTYSSLKADQIVEHGRYRPSFKMVFNPPYHFLRLYFGYRLFMCGWPGFIEAMTGAVYSFMTEAKVYQRRVRAQRETTPDVHDIAGRESR